MTPREWRKVVRRLPTRPCGFPYRQDDYALHLLKAVAGQGTSVRALRSSPFAKLLDRPRVAEVLAGRGDGRVDALDFGLARGRDAEIFNLTWGRWGTMNPRNWSRSGYQMARRGLNLVVHLNLPEAHVRDYRRLVKPERRHPFQLRDHPRARPDQLTLAWARIDLDLENREALIEEVQSDWVREAEDTVAYGWDLPEASGSAAQIETYVRYALKPISGIWAEAMLTAAIWVLRETLKIGRIFYYDYETSSLCKHGAPLGTGPRSLYTDLPKKFCFERVSGAPRFLEPTFQTALRHRFVHHDPVFWRLPAAGRAALGLSTGTLRRRSF